MPGREPAIETLEQLSAWIDVQLLQLECRHQKFETVRSMRGYFQNDSRR